MTKDEADAIIEAAKRLLDEDVSCETRCRLAKKIITHARAIRAACMAEPEISVHVYTGHLPACVLVADKQMAADYEIGKTVADCVMRFPFACGINRETM